MLIDILIPTYNRAQDLTENIHLLYKQIEKDSLFDQCQIIITDNCSPDNTQSAITALIQQYPKLTIQYYRNEENIGLEPNAVKVLSKASSPFVMFLGDDDYLENGYLVYCINKIQGIKNLGGIIPGLTAVYADGTEKPSRIENFEEEVLEAGYDTVWKYSHFGHQMSGLLCLRNQLLETYLAKKEYRNPYLFLYFITNRMANYTTVYAPKYKTKVNVHNGKDWGYNTVGLLDEVYKCYYPLVDQFGEEKVAKLLHRFTVIHSYRLAFKSKSITKLYKQYKQLVKTTPPLKGFKAGLKKIFIKDYLKSLTGK